MKVLRGFVAFFVLMSVLVSCRKERSFESSTGTPIINGQWQFSEAGTMFSGPMDSAFIRTIGVANSLNMSGVSADGKGQITLQVLSNGTIVKGDYKNPQVLFQYSLNGSLIFQNSGTDDFTITITSIDSISVTGTFSGIAIDSVGNKQTISGGKFTAPLSGIAPPAVGKGTLTLWSKQLCGGTGNIYIKAGDSVGAITQAYPTAPACGAPGTASFTLPAGSYTVIAACGTDTLTLSAAVLPDVCSTLEVDFSLVNQDYFPLQNRWTYGNVDDYNNDTLAIESAGDTTIGVDAFTKFVNDKTGETNYYRKSNGVYYQYLSNVYGQTLSQPLQIIILQDNVDVGTTWNSDPYDVDFGSAGIPYTLTVRLQNTISQKNYSMTIGGKTYNDCIEVTSELYQLSGTSWVDADTGYKTIFARGVGMIYYQDLNSGTDWQIRNYNVSF